MCTYANCKDPKFYAQTLWGKSEIINFCEKHCPPWLPDLRIGERIKFYKRERELMRWAKSRNIMADQVNYYGLQLIGWDEI